MKWLLIIILICVIMLIARALSEQIKDKYDFYYNLKQFLSKFKINLAFKQTKILEFLNQTNSKKYFKEFINCYEEYIKTSKLNLAPIKILEEEEKKELEDIIVNTGKFDTKNEISQIETFLISVEMKLKKTEEDKNKLCPMILKLALLFAIGLAILLI